MTSGSRLPANNGLQHDDSSSQPAGEIQTGSSNTMPAIIKRTLDHYRYPIMINNSRWKVLTTGTVRGHEIYCHLQETPPINCSQSAHFQARQIADFVPLHEVFNATEIGLIQRIIDCRVPSCHPPQIATEICINWIILKQDGYSREEINQAIQTGIELGILHYGYDGMRVGRTLHVY